MRNLWMCRLGLLVLTAAASMGCPSDEEDNNASTTPDVDMGVTPTSPTSSNNATDMDLPDLRPGCDEPEPFGIGELGEQKCVEGFLRLCDGNVWVRTPTACEAMSSLNVVDLSLAQIVSGTGDMVQETVELRVTLSNNGDFTLKRLGCRWSLARNETDELLGNGEMTPEDGEELESLRPTQAVNFVGTFDPGEESLSRNLKYTAECQGNDPDNLVVRTDSQLIRE